MEKHLESMERAGYDDVDDFKNFNARSLELLRAALASRACADVTEWFAAPLVGISEPMLDSLLFRVRLNDTAPPQQRRVATHPRFGAGLFRARWVGGESAYSVPSASRRSTRKSAVLSLVA